MKGKNLNEQMINEIDQFEKSLEDKIKEISSKEECLEYLERLRTEYSFKSYEVLQRVLNSFEKAYVLARNRAIELGADVSKYSVTISGNNE